MLATAHGRSWEGVQKRPCIQLLLKEKIFERYVFLKGIGEIADILDADGRRIDGVA